MWKQLTIVIVVILVVAFGIGAFIEVEGVTENGTQAEITLVFRNTDTGEAEELSMALPKSISLADTLMNGANIGSFGTFSTSTDDTTFYASEEIEVIAVADIWWSTSDIEEMNYVQFVQSGTTSDGDLLYLDSDLEYDSYKVKDATVSSTERSESNPLTVPDTDLSDKFFSYDGNGDKLTAGALDGGTISGEVKAEGTEIETGDTVTATTSVSLNISLDVDEADGTMTISAEISDLQYREQ